MAVAHDKRLDATIIAGFGSGKTVGIGAVFTYWCCMIPNFKAMDAAPVGWQAKQMYDAIRQELADYDNRHERPTRLSRLITRVVEKPYPKITFHNGLTIEFMSADNPYLTADQLGAIKRRIKDPEKRKQLTKSERPLPRGNEFTPELLEPRQSREMDDVMRHARENNLRGYYVEETQQAGTVLWVRPPNEFDRYVLIGDPGQNTPPDRNSGVVVVLRVTGFPQVPAEVAAFHWVDGQGSYWPFINQMEEWYRAYRPIYTAFDASGTQKGFDELVFAQKGMLVEGVQVNTNKMRMVVALKLILGKQKLLMPREIQGIWMQLADWRMPDTKLRQDIASCLFMTADVLNRLFVIDESEQQEMEVEEVVGASQRRRAHRDHRGRLLRQNFGRVR